MMSDSRYSRATLMVREAFSVVESDITAKIEHQMACADEAKARVAELEAVVSRNPFDRVQELEAERDELQRANMSLLEDGMAKISEAEAKVERLRKAIESVLLATQGEVFVILQRALTDEGEKK